MSRRHGLCGTAVAKLLAAPLLSRLYLLCDCSGSGWAQISSVLEDNLFFLHRVVSELCFQRSGSYQRHLVQHL